MKKFLLLFCIFSLSVQAQLQDSHFYKVDSKEISSNFEVDSFWKTHVEGFFLSNRESRERLMKVKLYGKFDLEFNSYVYARFEPYLVIKEGEVQSRRLTRSNSPIQMNQGFFDIRPAEGFSLQMGAINQEYLSSPLLLDNYSFLSALFSYSYIKETYEIQTVLQQSMPSVVNSFKRDNEIADVPYFTSLFTYGEWLPSDYYSFKGHITGFYFTKLPSFIAHESKSYGNTVTGELSSAQFEHSYYGINFDVSSQIKIRPELYLSIGYNGLRNFDAPFDKSWGERVYSILDMSFWKWAKLYSRFEYFYNNSDSAPAYFNSAIYGHNNRKGFLMELKAFIPKGNFEIGFRYVLSDPIQQYIVSSSIGKRQHSFMVFIGSRYLPI
ncbi:MAG: hypothetical protein OXM55_07205 [Bdellovibrionales bacterium]|nr:hypothetical protein [Bdellovibrionales bacterium]